jgi:hypothetical protein
MCNKNCEKLGVVYMRQRYYYGNTVLDILKDSHVFSRSEQERGDIFYPAFSLCMYVSMYASVGPEQWS